MDVTVSSQLHQNDRRNEGRNEPTLCGSNPAVNTPTSTSKNVTFSFCWLCHKKSIGKRVLLPLIHVQRECMYNTYNRCPIVSVGAFAFPQMNWSQTLNGLLSIPAGAWMAEWQTISEPALLTEHLLLDISCNVNKTFETVEVKSAGKSFLNIKDIRSVTQGGENAARIYILRTSNAVHIFLKVDHV